MILTNLFKHSRMARRGGVKRISADIYDSVRRALKQRLETVSVFCGSLGTRHLTFCIAPS
jgi:hypothetical protein